jgi:hypothetical protein
MAGFVPAISIYTGHSVLNSRMLGMMRAKSA